MHVKKSNFLCRDIKSIRKVKLNFNGEFTLIETLKLQWIHHRDRGHSAPLTATGVFPDKYFLVTEFSKFNENIWGKSIVTFSVQFLVSVKSVNLAVEGKNEHILHLNLTVAALQATFALNALKWHMMGKIQNIKINGF